LVDSVWRAALACVRDIATLRLSRGNAFSYLQCSDLDILERR
jgi:hypothetical protein